MVAFVVVCALAQLPSTLDGLPRVESKALPIFLLDPARVSGPEGTFTVDLRINAHGNVESATVAGKSSVKSGFIKDMVKAAKLWHFEPAVRASTAAPAAVTMVVTIKKIPKRHGKPGEMKLDAHLALEGAVDDFENGTVDENDPEVTLPREKRFVEPSYTSGALTRKVSGLVYVQAVVMPDGTVGRARIVRSLDPELDVQALKAVRQWTFEPARRNDQSAAMAVILEVVFRVH
jgi:protein TonB